MSGQHCGVVVLRASEGDTLHLGLTRPTVKAGAATGSRRLGVIDSWLPPGGGFKVQHWHEDFGEAFDVLDGQIDYLTGSTWITAGPGSTIFVRHSHPRLPQHRRPARPPPGDRRPGGDGRTRPRPRHATPGQFEAVHEQHRSHLAHPVAPLPAAVTGRSNR